MAADFPEKDAKTLLTTLDLESLTDSIMRGMYPDVNSYEIDTLAAETAASMATQHVLYSRLAARIVASLNHKYTPQTFSESIAALDTQINYIDKEGYPPLQIGSFEYSGNNEIEISGAISSQFISALLLIAPELPKGLTLHIKGGLISKPYVQMTLNLMNKCGVVAPWDGNRISVNSQDYSMGKICVEADWSAASYFYSLLAISKGGRLHLRGLEKNSIQGDAVVVDLFEHLGVTTHFFEDGIIISFFLNIAPILIFSGRFEFLSSLSISSEESIISASITS